MRAFGETKTKSRELMLKMDNIISLCGVMVPNRITGKLNASNLVGVELRELNEV